jgi:aconitase A
VELQIGEKYIRIKEITITLDHNINFTQLISIDLETLKTEVSLITMPFMKIQIPQNIKQILFFFEDKIYQINLPEKMKIDLKDLNVMN